MWEFFNVIGEAIRSMFIMAAGFALICLIAYSLREEDERDFDD